MIPVEQTTRDSLHPLKPFFAPEELYSALRNLAQFQAVSIEILEARLPDGSRVEPILPPAGSGGPHVPSGECVLVIDDARERQLQRAHVVHLEAQKPDRRGHGGVAVRDLFKAPLRMRLDRSAVGEIRSGEALELVQAMTSGHGGCMSTVHATYPTDTLSRLETLALMSSVVLPLSALRALQTARIPAGSRGVTHVTDVLGLGELPQSICRAAQTHRHRT